LMLSRLTEALVQDLPGDSTLRNYGPTLAFFAPDVGKILAPRRTFSLLQNRPARFAARAFAVGFIGDMAFTGIQHIRLGEGATRERYVNFRAAQLRRQSGDISSFSWRNVVRFLAPTVGDHVDSHDYLVGQENSYRRDILHQDLELTRQMHSSLREEVPVLVQELGGDWRAVLGESHHLSPLEADIRDHLVHVRLGEDLPQGATLDQTARWIQEEFSGHSLELSQVRRHLARIHLVQIQENLSFLAQSGVPETQTFSQFFNASGHLLPGMEGEFQSWLNPDPFPTTRRIVESFSLPPSS